MLFFCFFFGKTNKQMKKMNQPNVLTMSILVGTFYPHCDIKHTHTHTYTYTHKRIIGTLNKNRTTFKRCFAFKHLNYEHSV